MPKIYGIDKKRLESEETYWKNTDLNDDSNLNSLMFVQTILASLVPIESEKKEEHQDDCQLNVLQECTCKKRYEKEERCTKCGGVGKLMYTDKKTYSELGTCTHCAGSGKESRKEELKPIPFTIVNEMNDKIFSLEAKLSRYKEALMAILDYQSSTARDKEEHMAIEQATSTIRNIARTALAEEEKGRLV